MFIAKSCFVTFKLIFVFIRDENKFCRRTFNCFFNQIRRLGNLFIPLFEFLMLPWMMKVNVHATCWRNCKSCERPNTYLPTALWNDVTRHIGMSRMVVPVRECPPIPIALNEKHITTDQLTEKKILFQTKEIIFKIFSSIFDFLFFISAIIGIFFIYLRYIQKPIAIYAWIKANRHSSSISCWDSDSKSLVSSHNH